MDYRQGFKLGVWFAGTMEEARNVPLTGEAREGFMAGYVARVLA